MARFTNFANDVLNGAIDDDDTAIVLADASEFPTEKFYIVIEPTDETLREIVYIVSRSSNTLTAGVRGDKGTTASSHADAVQVIHTVLAHDLEGINELDAHGSTGATETIDLSTGDTHTATLDASCTFTFSNADEVNWFVLILTQTTGAELATWPGSVLWAAGTPPTLSTGAGDIDVLTFVTTDSGTTWYGFLAGAGFSLPGEQSIYDKMLASSPSYLWRLNDSSGTTAVEAVSSVDGTYTNTEDLTLAVSGPDNDAVHIIGDGAGDGAVMLPDPVGDILAGTEFSVELWFRPTVSASGYSLFSCATSDGWTQPFHMNLQAGETIRVLYGTASGDEDIVFHGAIPLVMNEWNHIVWTHEYTDVTTMPADCYVNGVVDTQVNGATQARAFAGRPSYLGARNATTGQGAATGDYALLGIYDHVLTEAEVQDHFGSYTP